MKKLLAITIAIMLMMPQQALALRPVAAKDESHDATGLSFMEDLSLSTEQLDRALDVGYALKQLKRENHIQRADLDWFLDKKKVLSVCLGLSDAELIDNLNYEEQCRLRDILFIINSMINTSVAIISLADNQTIVYERERLRFAATQADLARYQDRYEDWEIDLFKYNCGLQFSIINDFSQKRGFFFERLNSTREFAQQQQETKDVILRVACDEQFIPRPAENTITDLAFPSARDAETLERCMRSYLVSIRAFGYSYPTIWVMDDAEGDVALEKQAMIQRLATEFNVPINYVGPKEKDKFIDDLTQDPEIKKAGLSRDDLIRIYFQPNKLGSNRNFVQCYCSGRIYATVDDDVTSKVTIEKSYSRTRLFNLEMVGLLYLAKGLYGLLDDSSMSGLTPEFVRAMNSLTEEIAQPIQTDRYPDLSTFLHRLLTALYLQGEEGRSKLDRIISKIVKELPTITCELDSATLTYGDKTFLCSAFVVDFDDSVPHHTVLVNAFGVHDRLIARSVEELQALRFEETEGGKLFLPESSRSGTIGFVSSMNNLMGAGSSSNDIDAFISRKDVSALEGKKEGKSQLYGLRNAISDRYNLPTTTLTTVDNRRSSALLLPGMIDSHPLGMFIQREDKGFKLYETMIALDHHRKPSPTRNWQEQGMNPAKRAAINEVDETGLMSALRIYFGVRSHEEELAKFVAEECVIVQNLRRLLRQGQRKGAGQGGKSGKKKRKAKKRQQSPQVDSETRQAATELINTIYGKLGGVPLPRAADMVKEKRRAGSLEAKRQARKQMPRYGPARLRVPIIIDGKVSSMDVAAEYLKRPDVRENILALLAGYRERIEEVERYSTNVHLASRGMREHATLPFTTFVPAAINPRASTALEKREVFTTIAECA